MKLFHIILKLIHQLNLVPSDEHARLRTDVISWEEKAETTKEKSKVQELYVKLHQGILFRLLAPFLYVFTVRWVNDTLNGSSERDKYLDELD